jgi:tetratricopeptide (TPR) repeat protein
VVPASSALISGKKDYENAVYALKTALEKDPNNANVAYFLALTLRDGGRPDLARPLAEELLRRNPGNADLEKFNNTLVRMAQPAPPAPQASTKGSTKKQ